jgi:hypothetical protein
MYLSEVNMEYKIMHDECHTDFWDFEGSVSFISNHKDYRSVNTKDMLENYESLADMRKEYHDNGFSIVPIFAYIHSGIALSLGSFSCPWDSGVFGFLVFKNGEFGENNIGLKGFVESWSNWLNGEVYGYQVQDDKGEVLDSCWGFIGYEHCEEAAKESLTYCINAAKLERTSRIKTLIKNRVPLEVRLKELA